MSSRKLKILILLVGCFLVGFFACVLFKLHSNRTAKETCQQEKMSQSHSEANQSGNLDAQTSSATEIDLTTPDKPSDDYADLVDLQDMEELMDLKLADLLAMKWNSLEVTCDFGDYEKVAEAVDTIPVSGEPKLSKEQEQNIKEFISRTLCHNGRHEFDGFFNFLKESGETIDEYWVQWIRKYFVEKRNMTDDELPADPWKLAAFYRSERRFVWTAWKGFVLDGSEIRIQIAKDMDSVSELPGTQFQAIGRAQAGFAHLGKPPISLEEMIKLKGKVLTADVILFIAHDETLSEQIFPYIIRYWFDPINNIWRPHLAVGYPRHGSGYHHGLTY